MTRSLNSCEPDNKISVGQTAFSLSPITLCSKMFCLNMCNQKKDFFFVALNFFSKKKKLSCLAAVRGAASGVTRSLFVALRNTSKHCGTQWRYMKKETKNRQSGVAVCNAAFVQGIWAVRRPECHLLWLIYQTTDRFLAQNQAQKCGSICLSSRRDVFCEMYTSSIQEVTLKLKFVPLLLPWGLRRWAFPPTSLTNATGHDGVLYPLASQISSPLRGEGKRNSTKGETEQIQSSAKRKSEVLTAAANNKQDTLECNADN